MLEYFMSASSSSSSNSHWYLSVLSRLVYYFSIVYAQLSNNCSSCLLRALVK